MVEKIFAIGFHHGTLNSEQRSDIFREVNNSTINLTSDSISTYDIKAVSLLKTCNRWELYGYGSLEGATSLLLDISNLPIESRKILHTKTGSEALHHIFKVAAGLDSMVVGDQEILSQFKKSFKESKNRDTLDGYMERLANVSLQAAKEVRKKTALTGGTTSLSYSAIRILKEKKTSEDKKILVLGLGKFGNSISKNIHKYFPKNSLTVTNRTLEKATLLSDEISCYVLQFEQLNNRINDYDIIISALETKNILLDNEDLTGRKKTIIDLSMPSPFSKTVKQLEHVDYYSIEEASELINRTWEDRRSSIGPAAKIVEEYIDSFISWSATYSHSNVLKEWKSKLQEASQVCPFFQTMDDKESTYYLQKSMGHFAQFVKSEKETENSNELLKEYLQTTHI